MAPARKLFFRIFIRLSPDEVVLLLAVGEGGLMGGGVVFTVCTKVVLVVLTVVV